MTQPPDDQDHPAQPQPPATPPPPAPSPPAFPPPPAPPLQPGELAGPDPGWLGRKAPLVGIGAGLLLFALGYALALAAGGVDDQGYWLLGLLASGFLVTLILLVAGITLTVIKHTRAFGAGLLISVGIGVLAGGGVCFAVLAGAA